MNTLDDSFIDKSLIKSTGVGIPYERHTFSKSTEGYEVEELDWDRYKHLFSLPRPSAHR